MANICKKLFILFFKFFLFFKHKHVKCCWNENLHVYICFFFQFFFYTETTNQSNVYWIKRNLMLEMIFEAQLLTEMNKWNKKKKKGSPKKEKKLSFNVRFLIFYLPFYLPIYGLCLFISYSLPFCHYSSTLTTSFLFYWILL